MVTERPRGILSDADREHLENPDERGRAAQHKREKAIPKRFENAIRDGSPLWEHWDKGERRKVFDENLSDAEFRNGIVDLLALIYAETRDRGRFEGLLNRAIKKGERERQGELQSVNVTFEVDPVPAVDVEDAFRRYASLGSFRDLSDAEAAVVAQLLRRSQAVDREEISEAIEYYNRRHGEALGESIDHPNEVDNSEE